MTNFIQKYLPLLLILFFTTGIYSKDLQALEKNFFNTTKKLQEVISSQQVLQGQYEQLIKQIDSLKTENRSDSEIVQAMKRALELANLIENLSHKSGKINKKLTAIKNELYGIYNSKIDSLLAIKKNDLDREKNEENNNNLLILMQKRFQTTPEFFPITFNPELISQMDSTISTYSLTTIFRKDYLETSLRNVRERLNALSTLQDELGQQRLLEEQREAFMDDIESQTFFSPSQNSYSSLSDGADSRGTGLNEGVDYNASLQMKTVRHFPDINQLLNYINQFPRQGKSYLLNSDQLEVYEEAIEKSKEYLILYNKLIMDKLKSFQPKDE